MQLIERKDKITTITTEMHVSQALMGRRIHEVRLDGVDLRKVMELRPGLRLTWLENLYMRFAP